MDSTILFFHEILNINAVCAFKQQTNKYLTDELFRTDNKVAAIKWMVEIETVCNLKQNKRINKYSLRFIRQGRIFKYSINKI